MSTTNRTAAEEGGDGGGGGGGGGGGKPFSDTTVTRYDAVTATTYTIAANPNRVEFVIVNQSAANLFVKLGTGVSITVGSESATIILPPDAAAGYAVEDYTGAITFRFDADDGAGYALATEGIAA